MQRKVDLRKTGFLVLSLVFMLLQVLKPEIVSAKTQKILTGHYLLIDGNYYRLDGETSRESKSITKTSAEDWDKKTTIQKDVTSWNIVTDGKIVYYSKDKAGKGVIYKMNIKSKKATKVLTGKDYVLLGGTNKYLYIGKTIDAFYAKYIDKVYIYNIKTKKMKERKFGTQLMKFEVRNNRVMVGGAHSDTSNALMEVMTDTGKSIFKLQAVDGMLLWKGLVYEQEYHVNNEQRFRYYECDMNGKSKTKIEYRDYEVYFNHPHLTYDE